MIRIEKKHMVEQYFSEYSYDISHTTVEIDIPTRNNYEGVLDELRNVFVSPYRNDKSIFDFLAYERYNWGRITFRIFLTVQVSKLSGEDQRVYADLLRVKDDFEHRNSIKYSPTLDLFEGNPKEYAIVNLDDYTRFEDLHWKVRELIGYNYSDCTNMDAMQEELEAINRYPKSVKILFVGIPKTEKNNLLVLKSIFIAQQNLKKSRMIEFVNRVKH